MKIQESTVKKLMIKRENFDAINVFVENFKPEVGRVTIECSGDSWSHTWCRMGFSTPTVEKFFLKCDVHYLVQKLAPHINKTKNDLKKLPKVAQAEIIKKRKEDDVGKLKARNLYDLAKHIEYDGIDEDLLCDIFGDEWWTYIPQKLNPKYKYVCDIIHIVKDAFRVGDKNGQNI